VNDFEDDQAAIVVRDLRKAADQLQDLADARQGTESDRDHRFFGLSGRNVRDE
jgi:hypothetical protein